MLQLVIGWGRYRKITQNSKTKKFETRKTVLQRMFNLLKGASLRPNEFAALYCAAYNNEENIQKLCPFVREHYKNRIACANKIMTWCNSGPANGGTKDRCEFEALVYLNVDGFCEDMLEMYTSPKARASCINIEGVNAITLTKENFETFSKNAKNKYKKVIYRSGIGPGDICPKLKKYFKNPLVQKAGTKPSLQKQYEEALVLYRNGDYKKALSKLLAVEANGAFGCDLLNDIAVTFLKLNQYDDCIKYCQKILKTADKKEYAKACYNAGCAYEKKGMYDKAIANYTQALNYYKTYGVSKEDKSVDYQKIYENAISRVMKAKKDSVNTNTKQR
jgi:tetratricopeptide (TPR) repeat protein